MPTFLDFVQPDNPIIVANEKSPTKKVTIAIVLEYWKSLTVTFLKIPPGVVFIVISTNAKTVTRNQPADKVAALRIRLVNLSFLSETIKFATIAIENPLNKELISSSCCANSFQYSNVISIPILVYYFANVLLNAVLF